MIQDEKTLRVVVERLLKLIERQQRCSYCKAHAAQCHKHMKHAEELERAVQQARSYLAS